MSRLTKYITAILVLVALGYFGNKGVQTYLGTQAVGDLSFRIYSLDEAKEVAKKEGKLVLADYSAIWCPSCRKLDTQVFANTEVAAEIDSNFVYARLDYDSEEGVEFAEQHALVGFPRVLILDAVGNKLTEMPLTFDPEEYLLNLQRVLTAFTGS